MCGILEMTLHRREHVQPSADSENTIFGLFFGDENSDKCYTSTYGLILQVTISPPPTLLLSPQVFIQLLFVLLSPLYR